MYRILAKYSLYLLLYPFQKLTQIIFFLSFLKILKNRYLILSNLFYVFLYIGKELD